MQNPTETHVRRSQRHYSLPFKLAVVGEVGGGELRYKQAQRRYGIQGRSMVLGWCRRYAPQFAAILFSAAISHLKAAHKMSMQRACQHFGVSPQSVYQRRQRQVQQAGAYRAGAGRSAGRTYPAPAPKYAQAAAPNRPAAAGLGRGLRAR